MVSMTDMKFRNNGKEGDGLKIKKILILETFLFSFFHIDRSLEILFQKNIQIK